MTTTGSTGSAVHSRQQRPLETAAFVPRRSPTSTATEMTDGGYHVSAVVPAKEREEVAVGLQRGEPPRPKSVASTPPRETSCSTPADCSSANSASTSETSIRQLAVPARNDSAPEQIGFGPGPRVSASRRRWRPTGAAQRRPAPRPQSPPSRGVRRSRNGRGRTPPPQTRREPEEQDWFDGGQRQPEDHDAARLEVSPIHPAPLSALHKERMWRFSSKALTLLRTKARPVPGRRRGCYCRGVAPAGTGCVSRRGRTGRPGRSPGEGRRRSPRSQASRRRCSGRCAA